MLSGTAALSAALAKPAASIPVVRPATTLFIFRVDFLLQSQPLGNFGWKEKCVLWHKNDVGSKNLCNGLGTDGFAHLERITSAITIDREKW